MLLICVTVTHLEGIPLLIHIGKDAGCIYESIVGCVFRVLIPEEIAARFAVNVIRAADYLVYVEGTTEMDIEGIPLKSPVYIVVAAASDVAELIRIAPVLNYPHQTGNASFHITFIQNICIGNAVLGSGFCVGGHNGERPCVVDLLIDPLICDAASNHTIRGRCIFTGLLFHCFLRGLFFLRGIVDDLFHDRRFHLRLFFLFLTAAGKKQGGRQSDEK